MFFQINRRRYFGENEIHILISDATSDLAKLLLGGTKLLAKALVLGL